MPNPPAITVENVSKKFTKSLRRSMVYAAKDILRDAFGRPGSGAQLRPSEFWALREVSLEVRAGEAIGIVGPNGSGKSTLLKILNGILRPDQGRVRIRGRVGALIELGAGFHPLLTGRENIFINGTILGMTRAEIDRKLDSIVDFAGVGEYLDMPIKHYSSGMFVRLGFAIAIHCRPRILLIDEILSVGDLYFQAKCFRYFEDNIIGKGVTICLVSHSIHAIKRLCGKTVVLNKGEVVFQGDTGIATGKYFELVRKTAGTGDRPSMSPPGSRHGAGEVRIEKVDLYDGAGFRANSINLGESAEIRFVLRAARNMELMPQAFLKITDPMGMVVVYSMIPFASLSRMTLKQGTNSLHCRIARVNLIPGRYSLEMKIGGGSDICQDLLPEALSFEVRGDARVYESSGGYGVVYLDPEWSCE